MLASASKWQLRRLAFALLAALAISAFPDSAAFAQQGPALEASRHNLSYGRYDDLRHEGIAGLVPDQRPGKFYRNIPGITGPGGVFDVISQQPNPLLIAPFNRTPAIVTAGRWLPPGYSLVVLENALVGGFAYQPKNFMRFGEGNFYATVAIPGTGIEPGMELVTKEQFAAYTANSLLWEAPDIGNVVQETKISGGTVDVGAIVYPASPPIGTVIVGGQTYSRHLGYADPLEVNIEIVSQRELPDGSCRVQLRADLSPTFGNAIVPFPQETYTWFRWAIEADSTRIIDVPGTNILVVDLPAGGVSDQVAITVVAGSFGPAVVNSTLPVTLATNPFIEPPGDTVGLNTFHSYASTLGDTETLLRSKCDKQPLQVTKLADPVKVPGGGGNVTYTVTVRNTSTKDPVVVTTVTDDRLGDISAVCTPPLPATLQPGESLTCEVTASVAGAPESTVTNTASVAGGYADDGTPVAALANAQVEIGSAPRVAKCNSATGAGSDAPETIDVDLGGFQGTAAFAWEMYTVKDRMTLTSGGQVIHDTQCTSGAGRAKFEVPAGATQLRVAVQPNCEGTTGTQWNFHFQCPAEEDGGSSQTAQPGGLAPANPQRSPITPTGRTASEAEPNDSVATAQPTTVGDRIDGSIQTTGEADFYRITLATPGELTVKFVSAPANLDMAFRVLDQSGAVIRDWQAAPQQGAAFEGIVDIKAPGTYVIEVRDAYNNAASPDRYQMVSTFIPVADIGEPNDTQSTATPLTFGTPLLANILPVGDADYYAIAPTHQGELTVSFPSAPKDLDMAFRVLDVTGAVVRDWQAGQLGAAFSGTVDVRAPGRYVIEVRDAYNNARSPQPYEMVASFVPTADAGEPNDTIATATPLPLNAPIKANILPLGDVDYYAVALTHQGELTVSFPSAPQELDMAFRLVDESGAVVRDWQQSPQQGAAFTGSVDVRAPGRYVIEVRDAYNNARSAQPYEMAASLVPTADAGEPNDTVSTATSLTLNAPIRANILPLGDVDYYAVTLPGQGKLAVSFPSVPQDVDMAFRLLDATGAVVRDWQAGQKGAAFTGTVDVKAAGRYVIEVRDAYNNARSVQPYEMVATFAPM